jgi:signal transduction histidine kinase
MAPTTCRWQVSTIDEEVTVSDRGNRSATPLIEGRACQRWAPQPFDSLGRDSPLDPANTLVSDTDLYTMTHDLKNQLTTIRGWTDLLRRRVEEGQDGAAILQGLTTIRSSTDAMDELLGDILDTGRMKIAGRRAEPRAAVDLWGLTERLIDQQRSLAEGYVFALSGPGPGLITGNWDARSVERILANLLSNAVKYSPSGGRITVHIERDGQEARLAVHDHGLGIPALALPHIFEPFYRVEGTDEQRDSGYIPGFGVGLFAAWTLARQHSGRIEVTSEERQGSTFTLVLPLRGVPLAGCDAVG